MSTYRHTIARIGAGLPSARSARLTDASALTASAWPLPVYGEDSTLIGRGLGLLTDAGQVLAEVEYFDPRHDARATTIRPVVTEADLALRDGHLSLTRAVLSGLTAATAANTPADAPDTLTTDPGADPAAQDNPDTFTVTENVSVDLDLPIADIDTPWDAAGAADRVAAQAGQDATTLGGAFLYHEPGTDGTNVADYRFPVADVIGGDIQLVPRGVAEAAQTVDAGGSDVQGISAEDMQSISDVLDELYAKVAASIHDQTPDAGPEMGGGGAGALGDCADCGDPMLSAATFTARPRRHTARAAAAARSGAAAPTSFSGYKRHLNPPDAFFAPLQLPGPTPITVTAAGEVYGHVADWKECHAAFASAGVCVTPPRSTCDYCRYHNGTVVTASGQQVRTGAYCVGGGHAPVEGPGSDIASATAHYDNVAAVPARGVMREDRWGPYFHGALSPGATNEQIYAMLAFPPSGDWRPPTPGADIEMVAVTAVNTPGFLVRNSVTASADGDLSAVILTHASPYVASRSTDRQIDASLDVELAAMRREAIDMLAASIGRTREDELAALTASVHAGQ